MHPHSNELTGSLNQTPLHSLHLELGAKMTAFAGYHLPLHYPNGTIREHLHTRDYAGFFDISHMGQIRLTGANAGAELEKITPGAFAGLADNRLRYTVFTNDKGGIVDDLVAGRMGGDWQLTVNAACKRKDIALLQNRIPECRPELLEDRALLALQGPRAAPVLRPLITAGSIDIPFMSMTEAHFHGIDCLVSRCGYTGEDGFEISVDARYAENLARLLLAQDGVEPAGLGARDTLRLEAGLCLYGHDIDGETNPVEAGLSWLVDQSYLATEAPRKAFFPGSDAILSALKNGPERVRVGVRPEGRMPVREGALVKNSQGETVGRITSGGFGPTFGGPVAMGYVQARYGLPDTVLTVEVRGREIPARIRPLPFVPHRYFR